mmetsp:Transcript_101853/g.124655  ORF Transcript_101853/g.124655 Transcript_101853/m.124655 type:complete len:313 (+) Transcript_101853:37-975(+)
MMQNFGVKNEKLLHQKKDDNKSLMNLDDIQKYLQLKGIFVIKKIASTIQGKIYLCNKNGRSIVAKIASTMLHKKGVSQIINGKIVKTRENIVKEIKIIKHLKYRNPPKGYINLVDYSVNKDYIIFCMDYCGIDMFDYVKMNISKVELGILKPESWANHVRILFKQMVDIIHFLHNIAHVCHKDISIENFLINNCVIKDGKFISHGNINICDFGLSEFYGKTAPKFKTNKPTGKAFYQAPEIYNERQRVYDGRLLDLWSLGITLFVMEFGFFPKNSDISALPSGNFKNCIKSMLCFYKNRSYITDIMSCPYLS